MKIKKTNYLRFLKIGIFFLGISLLLWNCEDEKSDISNEWTIHETISKKITIHQFEKEMKNSTIYKNLIENLDISNNLLKKGEKDKGKIIISTKEIIKVSKNNITTYTFKLEKATSKLSDFENLMIFKYSNNSYKLRILKYQYTGKEELPYSIKYKEIDADVLKNFDLLKPIFSKATDLSLDECIDVSYECPYEGTTSHASNVCGPKGKGPGSTMILDFSDCFNMGGGSSGGGDPVNNDGGNDGNNGNEGSTGGGAGNESGTGGAGSVIDDCGDEIHGCDKIPHKKLANELGITNQNQIDYLENNLNDVENINNYLNKNNNSFEAKNFVREAINFLEVNSQYNFEQYENWFSKEHDGIDYEYDEVYWENPNLSFTPQELPSWDDFYLAYPRKANGSGWLYGADNVYSLVGGDVLQVRLDDVKKLYTNNTCALKVSIALNGSGIIIPEIITSTINGKINYGTIKGADGKNYFLNAKSLNKWMKLTFGTSPTNSKHFNYTATQGGLGGKNFPSLIGSKKGIYSLNSSDPTWATGHADIFFENKCAGGCHYNARGLESIDIWVLD